MKEKTAKTLDELIREMKTYASSIYSFSKKFADIYEREQRHEAQAVPVNWSEERNKAFMALTDAIFTSGNITEVQQAAKAFVDICNREEREKPKRKWSSKKQRAYGKLLDCAIGRTTPEDICNAAIELAQACKPEREKPKVGEFYRDIFGNRYIVFSVAEFLGDGTPIKEPFVVVSRENNKGLLSATYTTPLEDFMNPTLKKE